MQSDLRRGATLVNLTEARPYELLRVQRLARELRLTDQMLSVDLDTVEVRDNGPAPAWTTLEGDRVSFAYSRMPKPERRVDIAVWLGTNAHELGHVLFSPRKSSTLMFRVIESDRAYLPGMATIHNIVEDQRQERLLLAKFTPWTGYLTAALGHHLVADDQSAWLLMAGRTWLPDSVRATAKARMIATRGQFETDAVTRIVGEYQRLTDPGDTEADVAWELLQELYRMFEDAVPPTGSCTVMQGGEPDTSEPGDSAPSTADESDGDSDGDGASTSTDECNGDDGDGGDADAADGDRGLSGGEDAPDDSGESAGKSAGNSPSQPLDQKQTRKALKDAASDQIDADESASDELDSIQDAVDFGRPSESADGSEPLGSYEDATDAARMLHRDVSDALLDLKDENEPGWNKRVDSGRLNVRRLLNPNTEPDAMFDRYEPGMMDASELEVVLLLDVSGSMGSQTYALGVATWAIRQSVDDLEGSITVITFDTGPHRILAEPGERPDGRMFIPTSQGGTSPKSAIAEAFRLLTGASARNRLFVVLTDGDWYSNDNDATIMAMRQEGVTTVCALLGIDAARGEGHNCEYVASIDDPTDLARLFRRVAVERISSWRR